jgi:hypothetical protein
MAAYSKPESDKTNVYNVFTRGERHWVHRLGSGWLVSSRVMSGSLSVFEGRDMHI